MTRDEMEVRNVAAMGEAPGKQYTILFQEVAALHLYWKEFFELFGTNDKADRASQSRSAGVLSKATRTAIRDEYAAYGTIDRFAEVCWER
jgi:hypothetical protein